MATSKSKRQRSPRRSPAEQAALIEAEAQALAEQERQATVADARARLAAQTMRLVALDWIKPRAGDDTRALKIDHVLELAESIEALGLIEPLVVDRNGRLLAGGHRLAACRLLDPRAEHRAQALDELVSALSAGRQKKARERAKALGTAHWVEREVPVHSLDLDADTDAGRALAVEAAENMQRRQYTRAEVRALYQRLLEAGFTERRGRPKKGEKAARPVLAAVLGVTLRGLRKMLSQDESAPAVLSAAPDDPLSRALAQLERSLVRVQAAADNVTITPATDAVLQQAAALLVQVRQARGSAR